MPLLVTEANLLSQTQMERGVIEEIIDVDELFALFPFQGMDGKALVYHRENTLSEAQFLSPYDIVPEGGSTSTEVTVTLKILAGDVDVDNFLAETQSNINDLKALQIASKAKGMGRAFRRAIIQGDSSVNVKSFDGLAKLTPAAQTLLAGTNGGPLTFGMLDQLRDLVKPGLDCFMMTRGTWRAVKALLRAFNGNTGEMITLDNFGKPLPAIDGVPVILNDFIPTNETVGTNSNTTSVYALRLNEVDGFHGLYGGKSAGIRVEDIGTIQNMDATRTRVKWYVATALKSNISIARLAGVTNI